MSEKIGQLKGWGQIATPLVSQDKKLLKGGFGRWKSDVSYNPSDISDILDKAFKGEL